MSLSSSDVSKIAWLARIAIDDDKKNDYARDLSGILEFVAQMDAIDTRNVEPMAHPMEQTQRLRPDVVTENDEHERFQSIAPQVEEGLYLVPRVIE